MQDDGDIESGNEGLDINCIFEELDKNNLYLNFYFYF